MQIALGLSRFQICCVKGCGNDARKQFNTTTHNPRYFLSTCGQFEHRRYGAETVKLLDSGMSLKTFIDLEHDHIFVQPLGHATKRKLKFYAAYQNEQFKR